MAGFTGTGWLGLLGALGALATTPLPKASPALNAGVVSALVKLRPGDTPGLQSHIRWRAARGECEAAQLYVAPGAHGVVLEATPLETKPGAPAPLPLSLFRVEQVPVRIPSNSEGSAGLWPDPLLPLALSPSKQTGSKRTSRFAGRATLGDSSAQAPLVVWAEVCVPQDQAPARYAGRVTLRSDGAAPLEVPVQLEVLPFTLPATSSLATTFGISLYSVAKGHGLSPTSSEARDLLHAYARLALSHRLSLHGMFIDAPPIQRRTGKWTWDFRGYDEEMARYFDGTALPSKARFTVEKVRDTSDAKTREERAAYITAWREHFSQKGWNVPLFFYAKDEPKPDDYPQVLDEAAAVHDAGGVSVLVTSAFEPKLLAATDILTPVLNCFFPRAGASTCPAVRDAAALRRVLGKQRRLFWYQSCMSHGCDGGPSKDSSLEAAFLGWASYMVDHPAPLNRAMGPLAFQSGVEGELYFDTVHAFNDQNPWEDIFAFGGNGDGTLFYPGTPARLGSQSHAPVASLRLKQIREGLEDYEYLRLLAAHGQAAAAHRWAAQLTPSGYRIERSVSRWQAIRDEMASKLTELSLPSE